MEAFTQLHKDLDTINGFTSIAGQSTTLLASTQHHKYKTEDLIQANQNVWDKWWHNKLKNNISMINHAKKGNYEEVAKAIDWHYNDGD